MAVFQPGEETAQGRAGNDRDGLAKRFPYPTSCLASMSWSGRRHPCRKRRADHVRGRQPADPPVRAWRAWIDAAGQHRSRRHGRFNVLRLQTIVSREVAAADAAVLTVGVLQAGTKENVIPDDAIIKLNVRTFDAGVRKQVLDAIERIVNAEVRRPRAPLASQRSRRSTAIR